MQMKPHCPHASSPCGALFLHAKGAAKPPPHIHSLGIVSSASRTPSIRAAVHQHKAQAKAGCQPIPFVSRGRSGSRHGCSHQSRPALPPAIQHEAVPCFGPRDGHIAPAVRKGRKLAGIAQVLKVVQQLLVQFFARRIGRAGAHQPQTCCQQTDKRPASVCFHRFVPPDRALRFIPFYATMTALFFHARRRLVMRCGCPHCEAYMIQFRNRRHGLRVPTRAATAAMPVWAPAPLSPRERLKALKDTDWFTPQFDSPVSDEEDMA